MALIVYDSPTSGNARKVRLLLAELGLDFEHVPVPRGRPRPDWYLELNPFGGVPTIRDGDLVLAESRLRFERKSQIALLEEKFVHSDEDANRRGQSPKRAATRCQRFCRGRRVRPWSADGVLLLAEVPLWERQEVLGIVNPHGFS